MPIFSVVLSAVPASAERLPFDSCPSEGFQYGYGLEDGSSFIRGLNEGPDGVEVVAVDWTNNDGSIPIIVKDIDWNYNSNLIVGVGTPMSDNNCCLLNIGVAPGETSVSPECVSTIENSICSDYDAFGLFTEGGAVYKSEKSYALFHTNAASDDRRRRLGNVQSASFFGGEAVNNTADSSDGQQRRRLDDLMSTSTDDSGDIFDIAFHPFSTDPENAVAFSINLNGQFIRVVADFVNGSVVDSVMGMVPMPDSVAPLVGGNNMFHSVWFGSGTNYLFASVEDGPVYRWEVPVDTVSSATVSSGIVYIEQKLPGSLTDGSTCFIRQPEEPVITTTTGDDDPSDYSCFDHPDANCDVIHHNSWMCNYGIYYAYGTDLDQMYWSTLCPEYCAAAFPETGDACYFAGLNV